MQRIEEEQGRNIGGGGAEETDVGQGRKDRGGLVRGKNRGGDGAKETGVGGPFLKGSS